MVLHMCALVRSQGQEIFLLSVLKCPLQLRWVEWKSMLAFFSNWGNTFRRNAWWVCVPLSRVVHWRMTIFNCSWRESLVVFQCWTRKSRFVSIKTSLLPWVMLSHARGWGMRGCIPCWVWLDVAWKIMGRSILSFVHHMVLAKDMNDGKLEYAKLGKIGLNNCVNLWHSNILQRAHQWQVFVWRNIWVSLFMGGLFHMFKSGQFYMKPTWVIPLRSTGMDVREVVFIWKIMMNPHDIEMEDNSNVFFYTIPRCPTWDTSSLKEWLMLIVIRKERLMVIFVNFDLVERVEDLECQ